MRDPKLEALLARPEHAKRVRALIDLGYDPSVAQRMLLLKGIYKVDGWIAARSRPVNAFRGVNATVESYQPKHRHGTCSRTGSYWVTTEVDEALGFTIEPLRAEGKEPGLVLALELPDRVYGSGEGRKKLSRYDDVPDDRTFLRAVGLIKNPTLLPTQDGYATAKIVWIPYDQACRRGIVRQLTEDDASASLFD